ncbi:MAG TPA: hypothetical protein VGQ71_01965 [Terriglobales bacterium]|jgi:hypothetical protein|nr:hypothetical protein [Terriglobales bacterium]
MACPYFLPTEKFENGPWPHPVRLPLGDGWKGFCTAPGCDGYKPADHELKEFCNLGYARKCPRYPQAPFAESIRFGVRCDREGLLAVTYVTELDHSPGECGTVEYDTLTGAWTKIHPDPRVQIKAGCYLESYLRRRGKVARPALS